MTDLDVIAQNAIDEATQDTEDQTETVQVWDDEFENWHIGDDQDPTIELPAEAVRAYRLARNVWDLAQTTLTAAVDALEAGFPEEARDNGWVRELFRGEITRAQLDARLAGCEHPAASVRVHTFRATGSRRCEGCASWLPRL